MEFKKIYPRVYSADGDCEDKMDDNKMDIGLPVSSSKKITNRNNYSIYSYFKKHPMVLITCISACVAVISFCLNAIVYIDAYKQLEYWGLSDLNIPITTSNQIYIVFVALLFFIVSTFSQIFMGFTFDAYARHKQFVFHNKYVHKICIRLLRKAKKRTVMTSKKIKNLNVTNPLLRTENEQNQKELNLNLNEIEGLIKANKKARSDTRSALKYPHELILKSIFISSICMLPFYIFYIYVYVDINNSLISKLIIIIIISMLNIFISYSPILFKSNRKQKISIRKAVETGEFHKELQKACKTALKTKYPIEKILKVNILKWFTNKHITDIAIKTTIMLIGMIIGCAIIYIKLPGLQKDFRVCEIDDTAYVVIYKNDNTYYLIESEIVNDSIEINTTKKKIVISNDFVYTDVEFKIVERILVGEKE